MFLKATLTLSLRARIFYHFDLDLIVILSRREA